MSSFAPPAVRPFAAALDTRKHVNYSLGMVLGVDDFTQEFAYLSGRDQQLARELLGYGTACGLQVTVEPRDNDTERLNNPQIMVAPGMAITPRGQIVSVTPAQCARLVDWLAANRAQVEERVFTGELQLYLVLCYRECATDMVPIPGEPCRSEDEALAASRLADDFRLELRFVAPDQREEAALRNYVDWLSQIPIADVGASGSASPPDAVFTPLPEFEDAIRQAAAWLGSPPSSPPDYMFGSPPSDLHIPADESCEYLRSAFRIWTTELRPRWLGLGATCDSTPPDEECVLLAELSVPLQAGALNGEVLLDETQRPYLLHLRMLQEWLLCGRHEAQPADTVMPATEFGLAPDVGVSERFSRADHTHGSPALGGDVTGQANATVVVGLRDIPLVYDEAGPQPGQVLTFVAESEGGAWQPADPPAGGGSGTLDGDVAGPANDNTIRRLQSFGVAADDPQPGQVLGFVSDEGERGTWRPVDPPSGGIESLDGDITGSPNDTTISRLQRITLNAPEPQPNQVLTFVSVGDGEGGEWQAANPPTSGFEGLAGDVTGPSNDNTLRRLQSFEVAAAQPQPGQVLTFVSNDGERGTWQPVTPEASGIDALDGDVAGPPSDTTINRLQRVPVELPDPQPNQVLTFQRDDNNTARWVAADVPQGTPAGGDFVEHPPDAGRYLIVAAGVVRPSGNVRSNVYNGLVARLNGNGRVLLSFNKYEMPDTFMYIVKAIPVFNERMQRQLNMVPPIVTFDQFTGDGFILFVSHNNQPMEEGILRQLELMVEVSQYEFRQQ